MDNILRQVSHIFIVDNNLEYRQIIIDLLVRFMQHARLSSYDPSQHPRLGRRFPWHDYQLVVMDVGPDTQQTKDWFAKLSEAVKLPPFIFLHTDCDADNAVDFIRLGAIDYICKNQLEPKRFIKALAQLPELAPDKPATRARQTSAGPPDAQNIAELGEYNIQVRIGKGSTAWVYRAAHKTDNKVMAIKLCLPNISKDPESRNRFIHEFELIKSIDHPNIAKVYELGVQNNDIYSVMELLPAGDLKQKIDNGLSREQAVNYTSQIAAALYAIHRHSIIHRDLKPINILFRDDNSPVLIDFGIARLITGQSLTQTNFGKMIGTPSYVSPEQAMGNKLDARTDLYTLGIILYEMLEGRKPFTGSSAMDIMYAHANSPVPTLSQDYGKLNNIVMRLLEKEPANRYATGLEVMQALQRACPEHVNSRLFEIL